MSKIDLARFERENGAILSPPFFPSMACEKTPLRGEKFFGNLKEFN